MITGYAGDEEGSARSMNKSLLLIFAHPDDESFGLAGTIARYSREGVPADLICATHGEAGGRLGLAPGIDTGAAREAELREAASIAGIRDIYLLGYLDGTLGAVDERELTRKLLQLMRHLRPQIVITFGPDGITGHPDHVAIGRAATAAFTRLPLPETGRRKLYYMTIPQSAMAGEPAPGVVTRPDAEVTTAIDIRPYLDLKIKAIAAHRSQPDAVEFVRMLESNRDSGLAAAEYLYLANPRADGKETDLFV